MKQYSHILKLTTLASALGAIITLSACGGGGSSPSASGGTGGVSAASYTGTISGLGSVVVNGVRFSIAGAATQDGDDPSQPYTKAFALGDKVTITGTVNADGTTGTATAVVYHGGVRGKVMAADTTANTFTVDGQTVQVDSSTVWDGTGTFNLAQFNTDLAAAPPVADYVEAIGDYDAATGVLKATRVVQKDLSTVDADGVALRSKITAVSAGSFTVTIHGVAVTTTYTSDLVSPANATLAVGDEVRLVVDPTVSANATALNTISTTSTGSATLIAKKVIVKREHPADQAKGVIHGDVSAISGTTWTIGGTTVDVSQSPTLTGLTNLSSVIVGAEVVVKGSFTNGVLVAKEIVAASSDDNDKPTAPNGVKLFGVVSGAVAASGSTPATFVVQGVTVSIPLNSTTLTLPTLGAYAEVKAHLINGVLTADAISTPQPTANTPRSFEVRGTASCATGTAPDFTGVNGFALKLGDGQATVLTTNTTDVTIDSNRKVNTSTTLTNPTCVIEVTGTLSASHTITATKVEVVARDALGNRALNLR